MSDKDLQTIGNEQFDRLVDGELSEAERRHLLGSLDDMPDGWRRCALAFLEAQCWKDELAEIVREPAGRPQAPSVARRGSWTGGRLGTVLAMAASFLVALILGIAMRDVWRGGGQAGPEQDEFAAVETPDDARGAEPVVPESALAQHPPTPGQTPGVMPEWQTVRLAVDKGPDAEPEMVYLPARQVESVDGLWEQSMGSVFPPGLLEEFQRAGYRFRQDRRLVPLRLKDGRQLVLPVNEVEFDYDGRPAVFH
jgi:hypothetical protein